MREFKSNQELFIYVEELISLAMDHGDVEIAQRLRDAIRENFTTSEILGELVVVLGELQLMKSKEYLEPHRGDISNAIQEIRRAFRKANRPG